MTLNLFNFPSVETEVQSRHIRRTRRLLCYCLKKTLLTVTDIREHSRWRLRKEAIREIYGENQRNISLKVAKYMTKMSSTITPNLSQMSRNFFRVFYFFFFKLIIMQDFVDITG